MSQMPPPFNTMANASMQPHRGTMILVLGILALVLNFGCGLGWILGIIAWVMGNTDLRAMEAGLMDRTGESMTKAGKICGMISVILVIVGIIIYALLMILGIGLVAAGAAGGAGSGGTP